MSPGEPEETVVDAMPSSLGGAVSDGGDSALASLPFSGFFLFGLALAGIAMLGLGAPLRRLTGIGAQDSATPLSE